jgi:hypothetical protein
VPFAALFAVAYQNWRPVVPDNCPPGFAELMTACWHQDPEQRPTVQQLLSTLQKLYVAEKQKLVAEQNAAAVCHPADPSRMSMMDAEEPQDIDEHGVI